MSADRPSPRPSFLGVGKSVIRRTRNAETAGAEPAAQTIHQPTLEEFLTDALVDGGAFYGAGLAQPLGILSGLTRTTA